MTTSGTTTDYYYQGLKTLVETTGSITKTYTNGPGTVGGTICQDDGTDITYYHYDAIGNVASTTDASQNITDFVQDAFGNVISGATSGYHLTTKEYFPDIGLYFFNARWYDPEVGRFISKDPRPSGNLYVYCSNNPVNFVDPEGRFSINPWDWVFGAINTITNGNNCGRCISQLADLRKCDNKKKRKTLAINKEWKAAIANCATICGLAAPAIINLVQGRLPGPGR